MKNFWIEYYTNVVVEAESEEEAKKKFFENDKSAIVSVVDTQMEIGEFADDDDEDWGIDGKYC